ncbi:MAG: hypothetical protein WCI18_14715, partial [Pseudomonadota bacterium]
MSLIHLLFQALISLLRRAILAGSLLLLVLNSSGCSPQNGLSKLLGYSFDGIGSIVENADGTYVLNWPAASNTTNVSYTVYQMTLSSPDLFADGINNGPSLSAEQMPANAGSILTTLSGTSFLLPAGTIPAGQVMAFSVVAKSADSSQGGGRVIAVKRPNTPILSFSSGNMQSILPKTLSKALEVQLLNGKSPSVGQSVWFEVNQGDLTLTSDTATTDSQGLARTTVLAGSSPGIALVTAHWGVQQSIQFTVLIVGAAAGELDTSTKSLVVISGNNQRTTPSAPFGLPFRVQALQGNSPVSNALVTFSVVSGPSGSFTSATSTTDSTGIASVNYTPNSTGDLSIRASWEGKTATFLLSVANESLDLASGNLQSTQPGGAFANPVQVKLMRDGSPVVGEAITVTKVSGPNVTFTPAVATTNASGIASFNFTAGDTLGAVTMRASWSYLSTEFTLSVVPMNTLSILGGNNQTTSSRSPFLIPLQVMAVRGGAAVSGENVTFTVDSGPSGTFSAPIATLGSFGTAETNFTPSAGTSGPLVIKATWSNQTVTFLLNVVSEKSIVIISGNNQRTTPSVPFGLPFRVQALQGDSPVSNALVTFSVVSGPSGSLTSATSTTDSMGIASVNYTPNSTGDLSIRASWEGKTATFLLSVANESLDLASGNLQSTQPGGAFANPVQVKLMRDGSPVVGEAITVTKVSGPNVTFTPAVATTNASGIASFNFTAGDTLGAVTMRASWSYLSTEFTLSVVPMNTLSILGGNNQTTSSRSPFLIPLQVMAVRGGAAVSGENVTFTVDSGPSGTFSAPIATLGSFGTAETNFTPSAGTSGPLVIKATWSNQTVTFLLNVVSEKSIVVISGNNQRTTPGVPFGLPFRVQALQGDSAVSNALVTFSVVSGPSGSFTSATSTTDSTGIASVNYTPNSTGDLSIR